MDVQKKRWLFLISFILPLVLYRFVVYFRNGKVSFLRGLTGFQVHHYHYGVLLVTIAIILILFHRISIPAIVISGFGVGAMLDGFISSLFPSITRVEEIINYQANLLPTVVLFLGISLMVVYFSREL